MTPNISVQRRFFFKAYGAHRDLHSFPTRRSSDLGATRKRTATKKPPPPPFTRRFPPLLAREGFRCRRAIPDRKSTRLNSSHRCISYAVFCLKKKSKTKHGHTVPDGVKHRIKDQ